MDNVSPNPLTPRQEKAVLLTTAIASGMGFADMMAVNTALPVLQRELRMDASDALWIAEIYLLFVASMMMMGGALGDRFGRRRILYFGIFAFAASSIFCAASDSASGLILGRAAQGLAAALVMPSSLSLLNACYPPERRGQAIGTWTAISSMMIPLGPLVGGAAVDFLSWHWIFLINIPLCMVSLFFLRQVPKPPFEPPLKSHIDVPGLIGTTAGLGALVFGLLEGARHGFTDEWVVSSLVASALILPITLLFEAKSENAMIPIWMFRKRLFLIANFQTFLFFMGFQGTMFLLPFFHIQVFGFSALEAGAAGLPIPIAIILLSRPVGRIMDIKGPGILLATSPFIVACGFFLLSQVSQNGTYLHDILPAIVLIAIGLGLFITPITTVALNAIGDDNTGLASAVSNTVSRVAGLISVAVLGVLITHGFASSLSEGLVSLGLNAEQITSLASQAQQLGTLTAPGFLDASKADAFYLVTKGAVTDGFTRAVFVAGVFMLLAGITGVVGLRKTGALKQKKIDDP